MPSIFKKVVLSFLCFLILFFSVAPNFSVAKAASSTPLWYNQDFTTWMGKVNDTSNPSDIFGERYTSAQVQWVFYGLMNFLITRMLPADVVSCLFNNGSVDIATCSKAIKDAVSLGSQSTEYAVDKQPTLFAEVFSTDRQFSGIGYIKSKIQNFSFVPVAHAQSVGFGFSALSSIQDMWSAFRNIAFGLFVLVTVVFAFMIMFRIKISPQVVISVQSAIPKILISLVLVTFSFAIAGFLIDLMYVVIGLISLVIAPLVPTNAFMQPITYTPTSLFNLLTVGPHSSVGSSASGILGLLSMLLAPLFLVLIVIFFVGVVGTLLFTGGLSSVFSLIILALVLIVVIIIIWMTLKILWGLFKAFANILLLTIFAPLQLTLGILVPNFGFGQWVKNYISNLSVFVVTGVLWLFAEIFCVMAWNGTFNGGTTLTLSSTLTSNPWPPLLGTGNSGWWQGALFLGVSFVLFTMIPKATELVQSALSGKPLSFGSGIGDVSQGINWGAQGAGIYANKQSTNMALSPTERARWKNVDKMTSFIESFTKGHR